MRCGRGGSPSPAMAPLRRRCARPETTEGPPVAGLLPGRQAPGGTREGRPQPRVSAYPPTPASAASTPPIAVHTHRSDHQPDAQPSSGSMLDSTADFDESPSSASDLEVTAIPGTSGFASE